MKIGVLTSHLSTDSQFSSIDADLTDTAHQIAGALVRSGHEATVYVGTPTNFDRMKGDGVDLVFNVCERMGGDQHKEARVAGLLAERSIPFTGSSEDVISFCNDKANVKKILLRYNIPTARYQLFANGSEQLNPHLRFPLIVKPSCEHNSIGIDDTSVVFNEASLQVQLKRVMASTKHSVLVEEFISGSDVEVGIVGNGADAAVHSIARVEYKKQNGPQHNKVFSYESKWNTASDAYGTYCFDHSFPSQTLRQLKETALFLYAKLGMADYGRVDFRVDSSGKPHVIEVNANPGLSDVCSIPQSTVFSSDSYDKTIISIVDHAQKRHGLQSKVVLQ